MSGIRRHTFSRSSYWIALCLALLAVSWFGWQPIFDEFGSHIDVNGTIREGRTTLWADTLVIFKDYPLFGAGFGTFNDVYPAYKTIESNLIFEHAHNDYLEMLTDGGIIGFLLAVWFCYAVLSHCAGKIRKRRDRFAVLLGISSITSISALLIHSIVDFNLHNGAVGLYFFLACAIGVAAVNTRYGAYGESSLLPGASSGSRFVTGFSAFLFLYAYAAFSLE